jgi:hypothetical protein
VTSGQADALARSLLSRVLLPSGAKPLTGNPPAVLGQPSNVQGGQPSTGLHQLWTVDEPMGEVFSYWNGHAPTGMTSTGSGQSSAAGGITQEFVGYNLEHPPAGVYTASLALSVAPSGADTSVIRADVQVIWYPPRTTAEYVPSSLHAVTITASESSVGPASTSAHGAGTSGASTSGANPHSVTVTITSPSVVSRLAAMLNGAYAMPQGAAFGCPLQSLTYKLSFAKSAGAAPYLAASAENCAGLQISVAGHQQPALVIPAGLQNLVTSLTHISAPTPGPASGAPAKTTTG